MLLVHTDEVTVDFAGFPLTVGIESDCTCDENSGCSECGTTTVVIDAAERDDGAVAQRLNFTGLTADVRRVLREALSLIGEEF